MRIATSMNNILTGASLLFALMCTSCWEGFNDKFLESSKDAPAITMTNCSFTATGMTLGWIEPSAVTYTGMRIVCTDGTSTQEQTVAKGTTLSPEIPLTAGTKYTVTLYALYSSGYEIESYSFKVKKPASAQNLYLVDTADALAAAGSDLTGYCILMADIDLTDYSGGTGWTPIGPDYTTRFTGTFDGNGHVIRNLTINDSAGKYQGLFGVTGAGAVVENLSLENVTINGSWYVGGLVGMNGWGGTEPLPVIRNCHVTGVLSARDDTTSYAGGLVGWNYGIIQYSYADVVITKGLGRTGGFAGQNVSTGIIEYCYSLGDIALSSEDCFDVGGFVGFNSGTIQYCHASGDVSITGSGYYIGGFVGSTQATDLQNYATGKVHCTNQFTQAGGYAGYVTAAGNISNCYATGDVESLTGSPQRIAGFAGEVLGKVTNCYSRGDVIVGGSPSWIAGFIGLVNGTMGAIKNCYGTGEVNVGSAFISEVWSGSTCVGCYFDSDTAGQTDSYATGLTTAQMKDSTNYTGWDFTGETANGIEDIWSISSSVNSGYPYLTDLAP